ncbi:hypothetical protein GCM10027421_04390 [Microbacterium shaanxiense]
MKSHRTPHAAAVGADPDRFDDVRPARIGEDACRESRGLGGARGGDATGCCADELRVQHRPRRVALALMRVAARQARRATGHHERAHARPAHFERDRQMGDVVAQMAGELPG